jgi:hypothetical protein
VLKFRIRLYLINVTVSRLKFETALLQNGVLGFRSPAKVDLRLKFKSSVISASFQARPGDL